MKTKLLSRHCFKATLIVFGLFVSTHIHAQIITTFAGNGTAAYGGDGGQATAAQLNLPAAVWINILGSLIIGDDVNHCVRKVSPTGIITTVAGTGSAGYSGDGGAATAAQLSSVYGVAMDITGAVYIADAGNNRIRKVSPAGIITTIAGDGTAGYGGDGGQATSAQLNNPTGVMIDRSGDIYIADEGNNRIRVLRMSGIILTFAGTGTAGYSGDGGAATDATLNAPWAIAAGTSGEIFVGEIGNNCVRKISTSGTISTFAGTGGTAGSSGDGGPATSATLVSPYGLAVDFRTGGGAVYISDGGSNNVRKVDVSGTITTFAGNGAAGFSGDCGAAVSAKLNSPYGVTIDSNGYVYIADRQNSRVRMVYNTLVVAPITGASTICAGASTTFSDVTPGGAWTTANSSIASVDASGNVTGVSAGATTITYTVSNSCTSTYVIAGITVNTSPTLPAITGPTSVCAGATITLSNTTSGGSWSSSAGSIASIDASGNVRGVAGGSVTITYTLTTACGTAARLYGLTVTTIPSAGTISGASNVCPGATITLTDGVSGGTWSSSATSLATIGSSTGVVIGVATGYATISYAVTSVCGTGYSTYSLTINSLPVVTGITGASTLCEGASTTLTDTTVGGAWGSSATGVATVNSSGVVTGVTGAMVNIIYSVTNICGTASAAHTMTINPLPATGVIMGAPAVCAGSTTTLTGSVSGGTWSVSNANATLSSGVVVHGVTAGLDTVYHTFTNSCGPKSASFVISVDAHLAANGIAGPSTLCETDSAQLTVTVRGGTWTISNGHATVSATGLVMPVSPGMDTIFYSDSNACGSATASLPINIVSSAACAAGVAAITHETDNISVYPNPSNGIFTVVIPAASSNTTITILDVSGKVIETRTILPCSNSSNEAFSLKGIAAGSYWVRLISGAATYRQAIVVYP